MSDTMNKKECDCFIHDMYISPTGQFVEVKDKCIKRLPYIEIKTEEDFKKVQKLFNKK